MIPVTTSVTTPALPESRSRLPGCTPSLAAVGADSATSIVEPVPVPG